MTIQGMTGFRSGTLITNPTMASEGKGFITDNLEERARNAKKTPTRLSRGKLDDIGDEVVKVVDVATDLPNRARKLADRYTDFIIDKADEIKARASGKAEQNLKKSKISSLADNAGQWITNNLPIAGAVVLVVLFLMFKK